jgi:hypothetical protein
MHHETRKAQYSVFDSAAADCGLFDYLRAPVA